MTRVGVVLGAGGSLGYAFHAGVLAALHDVAGFDAGRADLLLGTSAGSVAAAFLAGGLPGRDFGAGALDRELSPEGARVVARVRGHGDTDRPPDPGPRRPLRPSAPGLLGRLALRPWRARAGVVATALLPEGRTPNRDVRARVRSLLGERWPERLRVVAVGLDDGRRVVFGGPSAPATAPAAAVAASCAIPAYYAPVRIDGVRYVDGGVHSPTNADVLAGGDLDLVVVSSPMSVVVGGSSVGRDLPMRLWFARMLDREVERLQKSGIDVVTIEPTGADQEAMGAELMDPSRRHEVARQAYATARGRIEGADLTARLAGTG